LTTAVLLGVNASLFSATSVGSAPATRQLAVLLVRMLVRREAATAEDEAGAALVAVVCGARTAAGASVAPDEFVRSDAGLRDAWSWDALVRDAFPAATVLTRGDAPSASSGAAAGGPATQWATTIECAAARTRALLVE
jgi:hypothetical protein